MELLQLRYFMESAQNGSFAATAEKYMVPATSVSAAVRRLEQELGCRLFDRTSNRIALNENGKRMLQAVEASFAQLDGAASALSAQEDTREIRMLVRSLRSDITETIVAFRNLHPHIRFRTAFDPADSHAEQYDIIIDRDSAVYPGCRQFQLRRMRLRLKAAADSPLCGQQLTMAQLQNEEFISLGEQSNMTAILRAACRRAGFTPQIAVSSNDLRCYDNLVAAGIGIGLERQRPAGQQDSRTAYLDITDFDEEYVVCVYYKESAAYGNVAEFLRFLQETAQKGE